jgi:hypothetical protein
MSGNDDPVRYRLRRSDLDWVEAAEDTVILDSVSEQYHATNPSGALLWKALGEGATAGELVAILVRQYKIDEEQARTDVGVYLDRLKELDLVEEA